MARRLGFLLTPRWIALLAVAVLVAGTCVRLGIWQLDRLDQRRTLNDRIQGGLAAEPVPFDTLRPGAPYRTVLATGTYDTEREVVWYGRSLDGRPGNHVLTPLVMGGDVTDATAAAILVDRGWVPADADDPPIERAAPPAGEVSVSGFLIPTGDGEDGVIVRDPSGRPLTVRRPDPAIVETPYELWPLAMQLEEQSPAQDGDMPVVAPRPELDEGPHLSYAVQWFIFATIALVGFVVLARREARERDEATG